MALAMLALAACRVSAPPLPTIPAADRSQGMELDLLALSPEQRRQEVDRAAGLGLRWLRVPLRWSELEPQPGQVRWTALDDALALAESAHMQVLLSVYGAPGWSRHDPPPPAGWWLCDEPAAHAPGTEDLAPPSDPRDYAAFLGRLARRYPSRVVAVEVWREPNVLPGWGAGGPDPEAYGRLLTAATETLRRAAPTWRIVSAGLAPVSVDASPVCYQSDLVFLDRLATSGALAAVDAVGVQALGLEAPALEAPADDRLNFRRAELHRAVLVRHGLAAKPLWLLAAGWWVDEEGRPSPWGSWSPQAASNELREAWHLARGTWPWSGPLFLRSAPPDLPADDGRQGYRLWIGDGGDGHGAALTALGREVAALSAAPSPLPGTDRPTVTGAGLDALRAPWWPAIPGLWVALLGLALLLSRRRRISPSAPVRGSPSPEWLWAGGVIGPWVARLLRPMAALNTWQRAALALVLLLANALLPPWPGLLGLIALGLLSLVDPLALLTVAAATLPWRDVLRLHLLSRPILPLEGLLLLVLAAVLLRRFILGARAPVAPGVAAQSADRRHDLGLVLLLVGWGALSCAFALHASPAWFEWRTVIVEPALFFLLLRHCADRWPAARQVLIGLVAGAAVAALMGMAGVLLSSLAASGFEIDPALASAVAAEGVLRARGPYGSPNNLALWLGRALPLAVAAAVAAGHRHRTLGWAATVFIGLGLLATFSRGSWVLGLPVLCLVAVLAWRRRARPARSPAVAVFRPFGRSLAVVLLLATALALLLPSVATSERLRGTLSLSPGSTAYIRWRLWQSAVAMIADHPLTGVGPDNFLSAYRDRYVKRDVVQERALSHPHNLVLDWAARLGLPGLLIGMLLLGTTVLALRRAAQAPPADAGDAAWLWGLIGMQAYSLTHGLVDNHFFLVDLAAAQWLLLAATRSLADVEAVDGPATIRGRLT